MKSAVRLLLLSVFSLTALTGCGVEEEHDSKITANLNKAQDYAQINDDKQARYWVDQAISVDPKALSTYVPSDNAGPDDLSIASIFSKSGDEAALRDYMKQATTTFPNDYHPWLYLEQTYGTLGDVADQHAAAAKAATLLEAKMLAPNAHDQDLTLTLAQAYCDAGNLTKGAADYRSLINLPAGNLVACNGLAYAWAVADSKPDLPQALLYAQHAVTAAQHQSPSTVLSQDQIDLEVSEFQDTLGWVQYRMGDYPHALENIQAAISVIPREPEVRYHLGMVYLALHQPDAARAEFTHATQLAQGYADAQRELGLLPAIPAAKSPTEAAAQP